MIGLSLSALVILITFISSYEIQNIKELINRCGSKQYVAVYDEHKNLIGKFGHLYSYIPLNQIPKPIIYALLATEDIAFWQHKGINPMAMLKAVIQNVKEKKITRGGSTITQQLAKNIIFTKDPLMIKHKTKRKIKEFILTLQLEGLLTKVMILEYYLNRVYFGRGAYGVNAAARVHFSKKIHELTVGECAFLVGLLKAPSAYSRSKELGQKRTHHVLNRMYKCGFISADTLMSEYSNTVTQVKYNGDINANLCISWILDAIPDWIRDSGRPLILNTTIDLGMQKAIVSKLPEVRKTSRFDFTELAFILCDIDGAIRVMIGGTQSGQYGFNRAMQSMRPAGSTFKLYVYLAALLSGMRPESVFDDSPPTIGKWAPGNYYHNEVGLITAERAFSESVNGATIRIAMQYGLDKIINLARLLGVTSSIPNDCSLILGSASISLYELACSLLIIANDGDQVTPYCIKSIVDYESGEVLWKSSEEKNRVKLLDEPEVFDSLRYLMSQVVESPRGTGRAIKNNKYRIFAKTGTSQDYRDLWFSGMTENGTVFVTWCGNDSYAPMNRDVNPNLRNPAIHIASIALDLAMKDYVPEEEGEE